MVKNLPANAGDRGVTGSIPGSGRSLGVGNGNPLNYSCLGNPMDREPAGPQSMELQNGQDLAAKQQQISHESSLKSYQV